MMAQDLPAGSHGTKHTPLPWKIEEGTSFVVAATGAHHTIAECWGDKSSTIQANADLIVRACNSHAELVEACNFALGSLELTDPPNDLYRKRVAQKLRMAIRKAGAEGSST